MTQVIDEHLLSTLTADEREAYEESLNDPEMQEAIAEADAMTDDQMKDALAGKDDGKDEQDDAKEAEGDAPDDKSIAAETEESFRPVLRANLPENAEQIEAKISEVRNEIERKFREGEIDFDEFKAQDRQHAEALESLRIRKIQSATYADMERQHAEQEWVFNQKRFFRDAKAEGIDYAASPKLTKDLDLMLRALGSDPDNKDKDADFFLKEAHKRVQVLHGMAPKATAKADVVAAANKDRRPPIESIPKTVGDLPGGGDDSDVGSEFASLDKLTGDAYERGLAKLSDDQRRRYLETA